MIAVFPESQEIIFTGYFAYNDLNAKFRVPHKAEPLVHGDFENRGFRWRVIRSEELVCFLLSGVLVPYITITCK